MVETSDSWILERTGIRQRHIVDKGVATSDLAVAAAKIALEQRGNELAGHQHSGQFAGPVVGTLEAHRVWFSFGSRYEASNLSYRFEGTVEDGAMAGTVALGAASDQNAGIVNRSQFGTGQWQARRVA